MTTSCCGGVDLEIERSDFFAIVVNSGWGKTVLLNHIFGLHITDSGRVVQRDHDLPDNPIVDLSTFKDQLEIDRIHIRIANLSKNDIKLEIIII